VIVIALVVLAAAGGGYVLYLRHIDATVPVNLKAKFSQDQNLRTATIGVTSKNGVVYLSGFVGSEADKATAIRIASAEPGVRSVVAAPLMTGNSIGQTLITAAGDASQPPTQDPGPASPGSDGQPNQPAPVVAPAPVDQNPPSQNVAAQPQSLVPPSPPPLPRPAPPVLRPPPKPDPEPFVRPTAQAMIEQGATSLQLPPGRMYLYGMVTGGALPASRFALGDYAQATNAAGQLCAALAYGTNNQNSYTTQAGAHVIGGVSISGTWDDMKAYYGSNSRAGASIVAVPFAVTNEDSLVVVIASAASEKQITLYPPAIQIDASSSNGELPMVIGHAYMKPGNYTVSETSTAVRGQEPAHMAQLIGVFVFGSQH
jgi:hypothetical protein